MNSKTNKALFTWLGTNDLKDTQRTEEESYGAITSILKDSNIIFNHIVILSNRKNKEVEDYLNVDSLDFLTVDNLIDLLGSKEHCFGCFTEKYPVNYSNEECKAVKPLHID